jgi:hypothetical protein
MGDTTVQAGTQPTTGTQGDPAADQQPNQNQTQHTQTGTQQGQNQSGKDGDEPLGPAGKRALEAERAARQALEKKYAPLEKLASALAGDTSDGKNEVEKLSERFADLEKQLSEEKQGRLREKVARQHELPDDLAELLKGTAEEELQAHAAVLKKYAPAKQEPTKARPKPDRSQGGGAGGDQGSAKDQAMAQARKRGFIKEKTT